MATRPRKTTEGTGSRRESPLRRGTTSLYEQIRRSVLTDIWRGIYRPGDLLPSESDLSEHFGVNRLTVRQAVHMLANQGFVRPLHGRGYQVTSSTLSAEFLTTASLSHYLRDLGLDTTTKVLDAELVTATAEVTDALGLRRGSETVRITRLRSVLDRPVAIDEAYYDSERFSRLLGADLGQTSLLELLYTMFGIQIARVTTELGAELAGERGDLLGAAPNDPLLVSKAVMYGLEDDPIECGFAYYQSERVKLSFNSPIDPHSWPYGGAAKR
ncbi:MAG: GntR family transcriptional regulator [Acidimicrobiaceae bacterium]|nr:GntR family transcriptional regulator [Acidimicrobiaceae bacterium]